MTIPASDLVQINPSVLSAGGSALDMIAVILTQNTRIPIGPPLQFANANDVSSYFGAASIETTAAVRYFAGYDGSPLKPGAVWFDQYNGANAVAAYLRGGNVGALGLGYIQGYSSGSLTVVVDGYTHTAAAINLSGATSPSNAATLIQSALDAAEPTEATFTGEIGATAITASMGGHFATSTTTGTTLTLGAVTDGYLSVGDLVSGTDTTNSLPVGCYIVAQISGTAGGSTGATFTISAAATPGNMGSATVTGTSSVIDATAVTGYISVGDTVAGTSVPTTTTVVSQLTGTTGSTGTYQLSCTAQGIASETMTAASTVLDVTVCSSPTLAVGQTVVGTSVTGSPVITAQISGTAGGVGFYRLSGAQQHVASESMTGVATAPTVTYDSISGGFVVTSGITGAPSTAAFASGTLSATLLLTATTGAVLSQGAAATTPSIFMSALAAGTHDWATFMTVFDPDGGSGNTQKLAFSAWAGLQNDRFAYVGWDTDVTPTTSDPATGSWAYQLGQSNTSGTWAEWVPSLAEGVNKAAAICGFVASIDFGRTNGRITFAFRSQFGLIADVTNQTIAHNLGGNPQATGDRGNGYNFYGAYATANENFIFFNRGFVSGPFEWFDSYINQIQLNNALQLALVELLVNAGSIPYNRTGYLMIDAACTDPIQAALNFGTIRTGVTLSNAQIAEINAAVPAGIDAATAVENFGYYLLIQDASAIVRAARASPPCTLFYSDGQSVQALNLASISVQ
jgi:hypothetical protein